MLSAAPSGPLPSRVRVCAWFRCSAALMSGPIGNTPLGSRTTGCAPLRSGAIGNTPLTSRGIACTPDGSWNRAGSTKLASQPAIWLSPEASARIWTTRRPSLALMSTASSSAFTKRRVISTFAAIRTRGVRRCSSASSSGVSVVATSSPSIPIIPAGVGHWFISPTRIRRCSSRRPCICDSSSCWRSSAAFSWRATSPSSS